MMRLKIEKGDEEKVKEETEEGRWGKEKSDRGETTRKTDACQTQQRKELHMQADLQLVRFNTLNCIDCSIRMPGTQWKS